MQFGVLLGRFVLPLSQRLEMLLPEVNLTEQRRRQLALELEVPEETAWRVFCSLVEELKMRGEEAHLLFDSTAAESATIDGGDQSVIGIYFAVLQEIDRCLPIVFVDARPEVSDFLLAWSRHRRAIYKRLAAWLQRMESRPRSIDYSLFEEERKRWSELMPEWYGALSTYLGLLGRLELFVACAGRFVRVRAVEDALFDFVNCGVDGDGRLEAAYRLRGFLGKHSDATRAARRFLRREMRMIRGILRELDASDEATQLLWLRGRESPIQVMQPTMALGWKMIDIYLEKAAWVLKFRKEYEFWALRVLEDR